MNPIHFKISMAGTGQAESQQGTKNSHTCDTLTGQRQNIGLYLASAFDCHLLIRSRKERRDPGKAIRELLCFYFRGPFDALPPLRRRHVSPGA